MDGDAPSARRPRQVPLICNKSKLHILNHRQHKVSLQEEEGNV